VHPTCFKAGNKNSVDSQPVTIQDLLPFGHRPKPKRHVHLWNALGNCIRKEVNQHQRLILRFAVFHSLQPQRWPARDIAGERPTVGVSGWPEASPLHTMLGRL